MKKHLLTLAALAGVVLGAAIAHGADSTGKGIIGSVHDMNYVATTYGFTQDKDLRLCAFCHTTHHAVTDNQGLSAQVNNFTGGISNGEPATIITGVDPVTGQPISSPNPAYKATGFYKVYAPLWSRQDLSTLNSPEPYVSATFNPTASGKAYDPLIGPSRLCLTCHDGNVALDAYYNKPATTANVGTDNLNYFGSKNIAITNNMSLRNDHPIGMVYKDYETGGSVQNGNTYELMPQSTFFKKDNGAPGTKTVANVLWTDSTSNISDGFVTCASCHDVHNGSAVGNELPASGRGYLLYGTQKNSSFCLTCHNKNEGNNFSVNP